MRCYEAVPDGEPRGAVVVIQEAFGVNPHIEDVTRRFAAAGYHAVAPDMFHRTGGAVVDYGDFGAVIEHFVGIGNDEAIMADVDAALGYLRGLGFADRQIGIVGFCFGGRVTFLVASQRALGAAAGFYGGGIVTARFPSSPRSSTAPHLETPWLGLFGDRDESIPVDDVEQLRKALTDAPVAAEVVRYADAEHGFNCDAARRTTPTPRPTRGAARSTGSPTSARADRAATARGRHRALRPRHRRDRRRQRGRPERHHGSIAHRPEGDPPRRAGNRVGRAPPPDASEPLLLAARGHHFRRWTVPRASAPAGRAGYLRWRKSLQEQHARELGALLTTAGYDADPSSGFRPSCARSDSRDDPEVQALEDALCLVFLETQLTDVAARLDPETLTRVIIRTARKMSAAGLAAIAQVPLDEHERAILAGAFGRDAVERYLAGLAAHDWSAVAATLAPDVERMGPYRDAYRGREPYAKFLADTIDSLGGYQLDVDRVHVDGGVVTVELRETVDDGDARLETCEAVVFDTADGLITRVAVYLQTSERHPRPPG